MNNLICPYCTNDNQAMLSVAVARDVIAKMKQYENKELKTIPAVIYCEVCSRTFTWLSNE